MAIRSTMHRPRAGHLWRRHCQQHAEYRALPRTRAARGNVSTHAARELASNRQSQARAMRDAFAASAVVKVEQFLGAFGCEATALVTDIEPPAPVAHCSSEAHAAPAVLVRVVEQV